MSAEIEAICVLGGDTSITLDPWENEDEQHVWVDVPVLDGATVVRATCVRPESCKLREKCTGKVNASLTTDNQFSKAILHRVVFNQPYNSRRYKI